MSRSESLKPPHNVNRKSTLSGTGLNKNSNNPKEAINSSNLLPEVETEEVINKLLKLLQGSEFLTRSETLPRSLQVDMGFLFK
jgi:hypothetical protein